MFLLVVSLVLMGFVFRRISVQSGGGSTINGFGLFTLVLLALVALCVYLFVRS